MNLNVREVEWRGRREDGIELDGLIEGSQAGRVLPRSAPADGLGAWSEPGRHHSLTGRLTSFVGRDRPLAEVRRLLADGCRLLTLTGFGGVGKTRLAVEAAASLLDEYPDGVYLVELAALADPQSVPRAVAAALDLAEQVGRSPTDHLTSSLRERRLLLVLDNCEHLLEACAELAERLLRACPRLQIVATGREALGIDGETVWPVPALDVPSGRLTLQEAAQADAVRLFVERARGRQPDFALTESNVPAVVEICRQLDGVPLAIELAAAWLPTLTVDELAARLDDRFRLLTRGSRTALPRHRTLRALVDWSYDLLSEPEQALLSRLSVFAGGWTLDAAERVASGEWRGTRGGADDTGAMKCAPAGSGSMGAHFTAPASDLWSLAPHPSTLDVLDRLVAKSLVLTVGRDGVTRYGFLETIRQYAAEQLVGEDAAATRRQHAEYFARIADQAEPELIGRDQRAWLARLEDDHENISAALRWSIDSGSAELALTLCGGLRRFWWLRGSLSEGARWMELALAIDAEASGSVRARALNGAGPLLRSQGEYDRATACHAEALTLAERAGDHRETAAALHFLADVAADRGDLAEAERLYLKSVALSRDQGEAWATARSLNNLGVVMRGLGQYDRAAELCEESLAIRRARGDTWGMAMSLDELARVARDRHDLQRAAELSQESLPLFHALGVKKHVAGGLDVAAWVACARGQHARAARLYGAAEGLRESIGSPTLPVEQDGLAADVATLRTALGPSAFDSAWASGRATSMDDAVAYALATELTPATERQAPALTPREGDVVRLIARGLSNRGIATELVISELTVESHVRNILRKLALERRGQVAAWAVQLGLT